MRLLVTRPEPDASALRDKLEAAGHSVLVDPMLVVTPCPPTALPLTGAAAVIATSRNALRALSDHPDLEAARKLPLFAVGPGTAQVARKLGFFSIQAGPATARELARSLAQQFSFPVRLVHVRGQDVAYDLKADLEVGGHIIDEVIVYRTLPSNALAGETANAIAKGELDGVILMSPRTAEIFTDLMHRAGLNDAARRLLYICLSDAVARVVAPIASSNIEVAAKPNLEETLALIARKAALSAAKS